MGTKGWGEGNIATGIPSAHAAVRRSGGVIPLCVLVFLSLPAVFCPVITAANEVSHEATQVAKTVIDEIGSDIQFFF